MSQTHHKRPPSADTGIIHEVVWLNSGVCKSHLLAGLNVGSVLRPGNKDGRRATIVRSAFRSAPPYFLTRFLTRTRIHFVRKAIGGFALDGSAACGFTPDVHVFGISASERPGPNHRGGRRCHLRPARALPWRRIDPDKNPAGDGPAGFVVTVGCYPTL
jgi:hypothetical protein